MYLKQIYRGSLKEAAYFVKSDYEADHYGYFGYLNEYLNLAKDIKPK